MSDLKTALDRFLIQRVEEGGVPGLDCSVFHHHKRFTASNTAMPILKPKLL